MRDWEHYDGKAGVRGKLGGILVHCIYKIHLDE